MDAAIPDFLRIPMPERKAAWDRNPPRVNAQHAGASSFAAHDEWRRQKARGRVAKMKAIQHERALAAEGKHFNPVTGQWE